MLYLVTVFILTVYGIHCCVETGPDQRVNVGTDVYLSCNFSKCQGPLDIMSLSVEWEFQSNSSLSKIVLYYIKNQTAPASGVFFQGDVELRNFDILLPSVTHENNGTYLCRLRLNGIFHKNQTHLYIRSAQTRRNSPGVTDLQASQTLPHWLLPVLSVTAVAMLISTAVLGRKFYRSIRTGDDSKQNMEEIKTSSDTKDMRITYKVGCSSMPVLTDVGNPPGSPDNIYVTMHGFPFTPIAARHSRRLPTDWQSEKEEPVFCIPSAIEIKKN